jgi:hypothetical protein
MTTNDSKRDWMKHATQRHITDGSRCRNTWQSAGGVGIVLLMVDDDVLLREMALLVVMLLRMREMMGRRTTEGVQVRSGGVVVEVGLVLLVRWVLADVLRLGGRLSFV